MKSQKWNFLFSVVFFPPLTLEQCSEEKYIKHLEEWMNLNNFFLCFIVKVNEVVAEAFSKSHPPFAFTALSFYTLS
jgi:hypothetical protein